MNKETLKIQICELIDGTTEAGATDTLTGQQETQITDAVAGYLETVNPNHDYPPTPRP